MNVSILPFLSYLVDVPDYCSVHPQAMLPDLDNCAKLFNCTEPGIYKECKYPTLFSLQSLSCQDFTKVNCGRRKEPQAPCEYITSYLCLPNYGNFRTQIT